MPPELVDLLRPLGPHGAWALVVLLILKWVAERVDKWAEAAIKQAVTNEAMRALLEGMHEALQDIKDELRQIRDLYGRRN